MSQEINKKRNWLRRILSGKVAGLLLAPALFSPFLSVSMISVGAAQTATQTISDDQVNPDPQFVLGWLDYATQSIEQNNADQAARGLVEALRGVKLLDKPDDRVVKRLQEIDKLLISKGVTKEQIAGAISKLGPIKAPPTPLAPVRTASVQPATTGTGASAAPVTPGVFFPQRDNTQTRPASNQVELSVPPPAAGGESGEELYKRGVQLLAQGNRQAAYDAFQQAWRYQGEMDIATRNQLKDKLAGMQATNIAAGMRSGNAGQSMNQISSEELATRQRMMTEVTSEIAKAEANREVEPQVVAERLQTLRTRVSQADLDSSTRKQLLTIVDRQITQHQIYMTNNKSAIDQELRNEQIISEIAMDQEQRVKIDAQIASLVETYNDMMDKGESMEAEVVAKQVAALDPNSEIASLLIANARNARRIAEYEEIRRIKEDRLIDVYNDVDAAMAGGMATDNQILRLGRDWEDITRRRARQVRESEQGMSPAELAIWEKLKQPVLVDFKQRPLAEVVKVLSDMTGVLMHIDEPSLAVDGYTSDMPVTLSLPSQISLRSALNLILNSNNLDFQVRNEVLMITSARMTGEANVQRTYSVKDLVIPIPNFVMDYNSGMAGALRQAYETTGRGLVASTKPSSGSLGELQMIAHSINPNSPALGQINNLAGGNLPPAIGGGFGLGGGLGSGGPVAGPGFVGGGAPLSMGSPGALGGGAAMADFDTLMNLIQQTIDPDSWLAAGGTSTILPYPSNLSIVVSAPQTTHERITELLESLRRLQDLQVTIEVKFVTLNDNFFERIGVDFDLRVDDNVRQLPLDDEGPSTTVGLGAAFDPNNPIPFTADFDVAVSQDSFSSAVPGFGGFDAASGASIGFAILSDLEMFFFMNAAQGDQRTNILQAPRVTMFDGQFANINDTVQRPFVTSLIPVVGDFAVAQQPVIVVLNEGTVLNVQATVSPDKRFVRLTLNPQFSQIDRVDTFTFEGSRTSRTGTNILDANGNPTGTTEDNEEIIAGTTVQQPSFVNTSVSTTVSVPDGGTILLGGIKRMREGRIERGVPILSKIPYVNRLFKNTAIGRETSTLMMTVTPRIIIQEEEEEKYGVLP